MEKILNALTIFGKELPWDLETALFWLLIAQVALIMFMVLVFAVLIHRVGRRESIVIKEPAEEKPSAEVIDKDVFTFPETLRGDWVVEDHESVHVLIEEHALFIDGVEATNVSLSADKPTEYMFKVNGLDYVVAYGTSDGNGFRNISGGEFEACALLELVEESAAEPVEEIPEEPVEETPVEEELVDEPVEEVAEEPVEEEVIEEPVEEVAEEEVVEEPMEEPVEEEAVEELVEEIPEEPVEETPVEEPAEEISEEPEPEVEHEKTAFGAFDYGEEESYEGGVLRYDKSFTARYIQSSDEVKNWYIKLKNEMLSYKKVKARMSWKRETFRFGRVTVARLVYRGNTLCIFLPLDPTDFVESRYKVEDASNSLSYADTPCMYRLKNEKRVRLAIELFEMVMERLGAVRMERFAEDYYLPYEGVVELINKGLIKRNIKNKEQEAFFDERKQVEDYEQPLDEVAAGANYEEPEELSEEPEDEFDEEIPEEETIEEPVDEVVEEIPEEPEEPVEETIEEAAEEPEEPVEETVEEISEEASEEPVEEPMEEAPEEASEEPIEEATAPEEPVEEPVEEVVEEIPEEPEEPVEEPMEEATAPEEPVEKPAEEIPEEISEEPVETSEESAEEVVEEIPEEPVEEVAEETPEELVEEPIEEPVEEPVEEPIEEPEEEPVEEPIEEPEEKVVEETPEEISEEPVEETTTPEEPVEEVTVENTEVEGLSTQELDDVQSYEKEAEDADGIEVVGVMFRRRMKRVYWFDPDGKTWEKGEIALYISPDKPPQEVIVVDNAKLSPSKLHLPLKPLCKVNQPDKK